MLKKLPPREREIVDLLYERGDLTVSGDLGCALAQRLPYSARTACHSSKYGSSSAGKETAKPSSSE